MDSEDDDDLRVLIAPRDLDDYDIITFKTMSAAVPHEARDSFRKLVWGALVTYVLGNSSVDHVLRRYSQQWEAFRTSRKEAHQIGALRAMTTAIDSISQALERVDPGRHYGRICAKSALCRLEASFKAAFGLVRRDYIFETEAVIRLILEQIAWSFRAVEIDGEGVFELNPTDCIKHLKTISPSIGRMYGELTQGAHLDPRIAMNYVKFHNQKIPAVRRSQADAFSSARHLLDLAVVYLQVVQQAFALFSPNEYNSRLASLEELVARY